MNKTRTYTLDECISDQAGLNAVMWAYMNTAVNLGSPAEEELEDVSIFFLHASADIIEKLRMIDAS